MPESNIPLAPVVILAGGLSHERDVSIRSGRRVATALRRVGHQVTEADLIIAAGARFWREILAVGGSRPALESFKAFRGREPRPDALLRHSGMVAQD